MNLLCPNCQKMLQVPEQYAGQQMKCPLCAGQFTVPALPQVPAMAPAAAAPSFAPPPPMKESPPPRGSAPLPNNSAAEAPSRPAADMAPPPPAEGYSHSKVLTLNQRLIPFVAPAALGLVLVLTFFPWVGLYPGGMSGGSQSAWGAAFGLFTPESVWLKAQEDMGRPRLDLSPGVGILMIFFTILFVLFVLPLAIASVVAAGGQIKLPPAVTPLLPWRAAILAGLVLAALVLLILQAVAGFKLESKVQEYAEGATPAAGVQGREPTPEERVVRDYKYGQLYSGFGVSVTIWFKLVLLLLLIALLGSGLDFWLDRRGNRPVPCADLMW